MRETQIEVKAELGLRLQNMFLVLVRTYVYGGLIERLELFSGRFGLVAPHLQLPEALLLLKYILWLPSQDNTAFLRDFIGG